MQTLFDQLLKNHWVYRILMQNFWFFRQFKLLDFANSFQKADKALAQFWIKMQFPFNVT